MEQEEKFSFISRTDSRKIEQGKNECYNNRTGAGAKSLCPVYELIHTGADPERQVS